MLRIEKSTNGPGLKLLQTFEKQIRFAAAVTLTQLAGKGQDASDAALPQDFHIRGPWWKSGARYGIKIKKADKTNLESAVYTRADWLLEAEGFAAGVKRPEHGTHLAVPAVDKSSFGTRIPVRQGGSITGKVTRTQKAKYLLDHAATTRAFKIKTASGFTLIVQRTGGRGGRGGKTSKLVTKYIFRDTVRVPHQSAVVQPVIESVEINLPSVWQVNLKKAIDTVK